MVSKSTERRYAEFFVSASAGQIRITSEGESPDFLLASPREVFGLELAQVFGDATSAGSRESKARERESRGDTQVRRIARMYYAKYRKPVHVKLFITDPEALKLPAIVEAIATARSESAWRHSRVVAGGADMVVCSLPHEIGQYDRWIVIDNYVGLYEPLGLPHIEHVIKSKSAKLKRYQDKVGRTDLLLVVDTTHSSGMLLWNPEIDSISLGDFHAVHVCFYPKMVVRLAPGKFAA